MKQFLENFFRNQLQCSQPELKELMQCWQFRKIPKNECLLRQGDVCKEFYFVFKGCLRIFLLTGKGGEKTNHIAAENTLITALSSFISEKPSAEIIEALEDTEYAVITRNDFYRLIDLLPAWEKFYRTILETAYLTKVKRIESLVSLTAQQRYVQMLNDNPDFKNRVANAVLASYIDVDQSTLSRIKKRFAQ